MKVSRTILTIIVLMTLCAGSAVADSLSWTVVAESTFEGNPGFIISEDFSEEGSDLVETEEIAIFIEDGKVRLHGFREPGGVWEFLPFAAYFVQVPNLQIGDSWVGLPHDFYGSTTATVVAQEDVSVPAGTFFGAYKVELRADILGPESPPTEVFWFAMGVGMIKNTYFNESFQLDALTELVSYSGSGSGIFPLVVGNILEFEETPMDLSPVEDTQVPAKSGFVGAYPHPFNPMTRLVFEMPAPGDVSVRIYDAAGRLITTLTEGHRESGRHEVSWNGRNQAGQLVSAGVYLCHLESQGYTSTQRVTLVK